MNLHNPMLDDVEKEYLNNLIESSTPELNAKTFLKFYHEDGLKHLIKNVEYWINNRFKEIISYSK